MPADASTAGERIARSGLSIAAAFGRGFVLPFQHLPAALAASLVPCAWLIYTVIVFPFATLVANKDIVYFATRPVDVLLGVMSPESLMGVDLGPSISSWDSWLVWLASFALLAIWLCTWQRGVVRHFRDPLRDWLLSGIQRAPAYGAALAIWIVAPVIVTGLLIGMAMLIFTAAGMFVDGFVPHAPPPRWVGITLALICLPGIWVSARLSAWPAMVAAEGWGRSLRRAVVVTRGRDLGLCLTYLGYFLAARLFAQALWLLVSRTPIPHGLTQDAVTALAYGAVTAINVGVWILVMLWSSAVPALLVRNAIGPAVAPEIFD